MTIKPLVNQKSSGEKKENHSHGQDQAQNQVSNQANASQRRNDVVYDDLQQRHRRSPRSPHTNNGRVKRTPDLLKRDREKVCSSPHASYLHMNTSKSNQSSQSITAGGSGSGAQNAVGAGGVGAVASGGVGVGGGVSLGSGLVSIGGGMVTGQGPGCSQANHQINHQPTNSADVLIVDDRIEDSGGYSGYNSGDEHLTSRETRLSPDEWQKRDDQFVKVMLERGFIVKDMAEDGACLFRAISLQIYGDQEMHEVVRNQTMDYIQQNGEYFGHYVTEDIDSYVKRKRNKNSHGNHIEIQAMSEIYNRPVELYSYKTTPINIFNPQQMNNGYDPLRLSYQRDSHYNAILDPYNASVGVGLGLAGYKPESQTREAIRLSEQLEIEQTMFEDKLKTTDWEATNEAIEEQIARESYLQWCRENMQKANAASATTASAAASSSSTVTSASEVSSLCGVGPNISGSPTGLLHSSNKNAEIIATVAGATAAAASHQIAPNKSCSTPSCMMLKCHVKDSYDSGDDTSDRSSCSSTNSRLGGSRARSKRKAILREMPASNLNGNGNAGGAGRRSCKRKLNINDVSACSDDGGNGKVVVKKRPPPDCRSGDSHSGIYMPLASAPSFQLEMSNYVYDICPGTSKQTEEVARTGTAVNDDKPMSKFYQSLLESSYTYDGNDQMSESEMLLKAIQLSRIDFIENQKRKLFDTNDHAQQEQQQQQVKSETDRSENAHDPTIDESYPIDYSCSAATKKPSSGP